MRRLIFFILILLCLSSPSMAENCVVSNCHGAKVTCGVQEPQMCTMIYTAEDVCRKFAHCEEIAGNCKVVADSHYDACVSCAEVCKNGKGVCDCLREFIQPFSSNNKAGRHLDEERRRPDSIGSAPVYVPYEHLQTKKTPATFHPDPLIESLKSDKLHQCQAKEDCIYVTLPCTCGGFIVNKSTLESLKPEIERRKREKCNIISDCGSRSPGELVCFNNMCDAACWMTYGPDGTYKCIGPSAELSPTIIDSWR